MILTLLVLVAATVVPSPSAPPRYDVVAVLATECPLARLYAGRLRALAHRYPQVHFRGVSANPRESDENIARFQQKLQFEFRRDPAAIEQLEATRSPEVFLLAAGQIVYRGRIDDQYTPSASRVSCHDISTSTGITQRRHP